jgi:hypothetical protein
VFWRSLSDDLGGDRGFHHRPKLKIITRMGSFEGDISIAGMPFPSMAFGQFSLL